jgi:hypothetical protein
MSYSQYASLPSWVDAEQIDVGWNFFHFSLPQMINDARFVAVEEGQGYYVTRQ